MSFQALRRAYEVAGQQTKPCGSLRRDYPTAAHGLWQASAFLDHAQVEVAVHPYGAGPNIADFSGIGIGLQWSGADGWSVVSALATPLGGAPAIASHPGSVRFWTRVQKLF